MIARHAMFVALLLLSLAVSPTPAGTLDTALHDAFRTDGAGLRLLREGGAQLGQLLTLERVPSGAYVAEVSLRIGEAQVRYPLKFERSPGAWNLVWQPDGVYAAALLGLAKSGAVPAAQTGRGWIESPRMPALPIIATRKRFVTPFGEVSPGDRAEGKSQGDLDLSPGLVQAAHSWVNRVLDADPGPAGIDLIMEGALSWRALNKVLFNASVVGLFEVSMVTSNNGFDVVELLSPVAARASSDGPAPRIVALYALESGFGVRLSQGASVVPGDGCAPQMTACVADEAGFEAATREFARPDTTMMFAADADVTVQDALRFIIPLQRSLGAQAHKVIVGYVQK